MSALWIIPSLTLIVGAIVLWWVGRRAATEATALQADLARWETARSELSELRVEAQQVRANYRHVRRR